MTHADQIMKAVATLTKQGKQTFRRVDVRDTIGLSHADWMSGYTAIFQGMRADHPGHAPDVGARYKKVFRRIRRGEYTLTAYGRELLEEFVR